MLLLHFPTSVAETGFGQVVHDVGFREVLRIGPVQDGWVLDGYRMTAAAGPGAAWRPRKCLNPTSTLGRGGGHAPEFREYVWGGI